MTNTEMIATLTKALQHPGTVGCSDRVKEVIAALHSSPVWAETPSLVALVQRYQRVHAEYQAADNSNRVARLKALVDVSEELRAWTPTQAGPAAPLDRVREVAAAFREGYRAGYERGESGEAEDIEDAWDRSKASAGLIGTPSARPTPAAVPEQEK